MIAAPLTAAAQSIVKVAVDTIACLGDTVPVSIGFLNEREIVVRNGISTLGSQERAFLPDGVVCNGKCSYEAPVTFTDFPNDATINSAEDILYIRLNIEHSFLGDIYMGIRCPSGQKASLMNWSSSGLSSCTDSVPSNHIGWNSSYSNSPGGTYLGMPVDEEGAIDKCDSTEYHNRPGTGWNYCWSDNTTHGYQYAYDDGLIYRSSNRIFIGMQGYVDSSDVAAGTNFYHPNHSFNNLIGCPLNGEWTIEVIDAYSIDNGYIFEWEMALDPALLPCNNLVTGQSLVGSDVTVYTDSTFSVTAPASVTSDTVLPYYVYIFTSQGDTVDTVFRVHYYAPSHVEAYDTICPGDTVWWIGHAITTDTLIDISTTTVMGCDSTVHLQVTLNPSYHTDDTVYMCLGDTAWHHNLAINGNWHIHEDNLTIRGCDSIVDITYIFHPTYYRRDTVKLCSGDTAWFHGQPITADTALRLDTVSIHGCDSVVDLVYRFPPRYLFRDTVNLCKGDTAYWNGMALYANSFIRVDSVTLEGCDSSEVTAYLFHPVYEGIDTQYFCPYTPFVYEGVDYGGPTTVDTMLRSVHGCDSLMHATLVIADQGFNPTMMISDDCLLWSSDTAYHGCQPSLIYMLDTTHGVSLRQWLPGDSTAVYTDSLASHLYDTAGTFTVSLRVVSLNGCYDTTLSIPDAVHVYPNPTAAFDWDNHVMVIHDAATQFVNFSQPDTIDWLWEITRADGSTDTSTEFAPYYRWGSTGGLVDEGDYDVTLIAIWTNIYNDTMTLLCTDTVTHAVSITNDFLKFPNLVTPNGDGHNDTWRIINLLECGVYTINELWIFNQWGEQVYHVQNISREEDFWDPTRTGTTDGTYYYRFSARSKYGVVKRNGVIEVLHGE